MRDRRASQAVRNQKGGASAVGTPRTPQQQIATAKKLIADGDWAQAREALDAASTLNTKAAGRRPGKHPSAAPAAAEIQQLLAKVRAGEAKQRMEQSFVASVEQTRAAASRHASSQRDGTGAP